MADIHNIFEKKNGNGPGNPPPMLPGPKLKQTDYRIRTVDKVTLEEVVYDKRGHIVVTANNIVLFDENQEMLWGIPNDEAVISFERVGDGNSDGQSIEEVILIEEGSEEFTDYVDEDEDELSEETDPDGAA